MTNNIGWAMEQLKTGKAVTREGWDSSTRLIIDGEIMMVWTRNGEQVSEGWIPSQHDVLATDWMLAE